MTLGTIYWKITCLEIKNYCFRGEHMKIHLIVPPYCIREDGTGVLPNKAMLPCGPLTVATLLQESGCQVEAIDLVFRQDWKDFLPSDQLELMLLSCHTIRNIPSCVAVLNELKRRGKSRVILGGNACLDLGIEQFSKLGLEVDAVIRGWGHSPDVIEQIMSGVNGDIWPQESGQLPLPAVDLLPYNLHQKYRKASEGRYPMYAFGTGCLWSCAYCNSYMNSLWISRPIEDALSEVALAEKLGYKKVWCVDNLLFTDPEVALRFNSMLALKEMQWSGMTRPELVCKLPEIYFKRLTSLTEVAMGIETVSETLLKVLNRGAKKSYRQTLEEAFRRIRRSGKTTTNAFVMLDLPGSTEADFWQLYELLEAVNPETISWSFYNPPVQSVTDPEAMGFYRWPQGHSQVPPQRVVQEAMVLSGTWWDKFTLNKSRPFFEDNDVFGANFLEAQIIQEKSARCHQLATFGRSGS